MFCRFKSGRCGHIRVLVPNRGDRQNAFGYGGSLRNMTVATLPLHHSVETNLHWRGESKALNGDIRGRTEKSGTAWCI